MGQDWARKRFDVVRQHIGATFDQGPRPRRTFEAERTSGGHADGQQRGIASGDDDSVKVVQDCIVDAHRVDGLLDVSKLGRAHDCAKLLDRVRASAIEHLSLDARRRVADAEPH